MNLKKFIFNSMIFLEIYCFALTDEEKMKQIETKAQDWADKYISCKKPSDIIPIAQGIYYSVKTLEAMAPQLTKATSDIAKSQNAQAAIAELVSEIKEPLITLFGTLKAYYGQIFKEMQKRKLTFTSGAQRGKLPTL